MVVALRQKDNHWLMYWNFRRAVPITWVWIICKISTINTYTDGAPIVSSGSLCYNSFALHIGVEERDCCQAFQQDSDEEFLDCCWPDWRRFGCQSCKTHYGEDKHLPLDYIIVENCENWIAGSSDTRRFGATRDHVNLYIHRLRNAILRVGGYCKF